MALQGRRGVRKRIGMAGLALIGLAAFGAAARAEESAPPPPPAPADDGVVKKVLRKVGLVADPVQPQDFVVKTRPDGELEYVPIGRKPFVRPIKAKTPVELKAIEADLETVHTRHDALRSTFAPAMKAVADAAAAKAAKDAKGKKKPPPAAAPQ